MPKSPAEFISTVLVMLTAFVRAKVLNGSHMFGADQSGVAAALCHPSPKPCGIRRQQTYARIKAIVIYLNLR